MDIKEILSHVDHTLLRQTAKWDEISALCDEGIEFGTASVCIPPCYVARARRYVGDGLRICTVIGFPNGYNDTVIKVLEAKKAAEDGADEIDMVINLGLVKEGRYSRVLDEIKAVREAIPDKVLKVIIETCLLNEEEKINMCRVVTDSGADFIKTSTGFSTKGAAPEDIVLFRSNIGPKVRIKAAGGIETLADAENFLSLGASRLGTSRLVKLARQSGKI
jgi:deoxyribose-phosphate aldolase